MQFVIYAFIKVIFHLSVIFAPLDIQVAGEISELWFDISNSPQGCSGVLSFMLLPLCTFFFIDSYIILSLNIAAFIFHRPLTILSMGVTTASRKNTE